MSDHVLYQIDVTNARKDAPFDKWTVLKRFGQFYDMDCAVRAAFLDKPDMLTKLPEPPERKAKLFNDHMDNTFVEHRRVLLQNYLSNMLSVIEVVRNKDFLVFFGCGRLILITFGSVSLGTKCYREEAERSHLYKNQTVGEAASAGI